MFSYSEAIGFTKASTERNPLNIPKSSMTRLKRSITVWTNEEYYAKPTGIFGNSCAFSFNSVGRHLSK